MPVVRNCTNCGRKTNADRKTYEKRMRHCAKCWRNLNSFRAWGEWLKL